MNAEDFDMGGYPDKIDDKPATKYWRVGFRDKTGRDRYFMHNCESARAELNEDDVRIIEKEICGVQKSTRINSVRFGCVYYQEEPGGSWKLTKLAQEAPKPDHFLDSDYIVKYFKSWRPAAYSGRIDPYKLRMPQSQEQVLSASNAEKDKELADLRTRLEAAKKNENMLLEKLRVEGKA